MDEQREVGVGPHPEPWPDDPRFDPSLLADGDRRTVVPPPRDGRRAARGAPPPPPRHPFHVAVENWAHDLNIGAVVRNANAFLAAEVHIVGRRRWNRRGAMVTDRYQHVRHHTTLAAFASWAHERDLPVIGIDNLPGARPIDDYPLPERCALLFGQEGPGLSREARELASAVLAIRQFGSTRSINAAAASAVAMHEWVRHHAERPAAPAPPAPPPRRRR